MGAAHEKLPHFIMEQMMVSNTEAGGEGWSHVDKMDAESVCIPPSESDGIFFPNAGQNVPTVMHFCQFYRAGDLGFQKRRVPKDIFSCDQDMLMEPPLDLALLGYRIKNGVVSIKLYLYIILLSIYYIYISVHICDVYLYIYICVYCVYMCNYIYIYLNIIGYIFTTVIYYYVYTNIEREIE